MKVKDVLLNMTVFSKYLNRFRNARIAYIQYRQNKVLLSRIKHLKGSHKGERCFIIGTGPSLTVEDLNLLKNEITFATNRIYEVFDKTDWRPTYYVNQDHTLIRTFTNEIKSVAATYKFVPIDYKDIFEGPEYYFYVLKHKEFYPNPAPFSSEIHKYLAQGFSVTYGAIQIALYMGFKEIYLLGIDHNYNVTRDATGKPVRAKASVQNYSKAISNYMDMNNLPRIEETTIAYETAEQISRKLGVRIFNATRGGKLEAFERVDFDKIVNRSL